MPSNETPQSQASTTTSGATVNNAAATESKNPLSTSGEGDGSTTPATTAAPTTSTTSAEGKAKEGDVKVDSTEASVVPEKYDLKLPENPLLKQEHVDELAAYAREQGLSNKQAQALLDRENSAVLKHTQDAQAAFQAKGEDWFKEIQSHKEFGGDNFKKSAEHATRAVEKYVPESLRKTLNETSWGNYPDLFYAFARIGKDMADDKLVNGGVGGANDNRSAAEILYPNMNK